MEDFYEEDYMDIIFKYEFESCIGEIEGNRYIQDIKASIIKTDEYGYNPIVIGKGDIKILLLEQAINDHYDIFEIFDMHEYTMRIGGMIFDFDNYELKEDLHKKLFGDDIMLNQNICIFERMTILPKYRGFGIGAKFVKDRYNFFSSACGLIVMQPYPLQLEAVGPNGRTDEFERKMGYDTMEHDVRKATKSLKDYYKRLGYISVKGYKDLMFFVPEFRNKKLEAINMDEMIIVPAQKMEYNMSRQ